MSVNRAADDFLQQPTVTAGLGSGTAAALVERPGPNRQAPCFPQSTRVDAQRAAPHESLRPPCDRAGDNAAASALTLFERSRLKSAHHPKYVFPYVITIVSPF